MTTITLIRGLPGSGKSTLAATLDAHHIEADMYFMHDGQYCFEPELHAEAHAWCQHEAREMLSLGISVVVSNTFTRLWEMRPYFDMARIMGATVEVIECTGRYQNVHGVPDEVIQRMAARWEKLV
ncbi:MAG: ATP-binding protein [Hyphomicrobiaceae bacterium]|nr:MAG: ATP-binding protein [Hyphomicrobiaceae bacterium]